MDSIAESRVREPRLLPNEQICQRIEIGLTGKIFECVVRHAETCPYAVKYGNVMFCVHPNYKKKKT
jgi:hypothetical protein